jgi:hypothetical protein
MSIDYRNEMGFLAVFLVNFASVADCLMGVVERWSKKRDVRLIGFQLFSLEKYLASVWIGSYDGLEKTIKIS